MTGGEGSPPDVAAARGSVATTAGSRPGLVLLALACGADALGGVSETGGAAELCALAMSGDDAPTNIRPSASSVARFIGILQ